MDEYALVTLKVKHRRKWGCVVTFQLRAFERIKQLCSLLDEQSDHRLEFKVVDVSGRIVEAFKRPAAGLPREWMAPRRQKA